MGDYAASVQAVGVRITNLDAAGAPVVGTKQSYMFKALTKFSWTPEYEEGEEIKTIGANGEICVYYKVPDTLKQVKFELEICKPQPEIYAMLGGGSLIIGPTGTAKTISNKALTSNVATLTTSTAHGFSVGQQVIVAGVDATFNGTYTITVVGSPTTFSYAKTAADVTSTTATGTATPADTVGWQAPAEGTVPVPNGVGIEVWSRAIVGGKPAATNPYWRFILPYAVPRLDGDRTLENGNMASVFTGYSLSNSAFGDGPISDWTLPSDKAINYARDSINPVTSEGYVTVT